MITDKGSIFVSNVIHEISDVLGITFGHATTKHAHAIRGLEKTHAKIMTSLKMSSVNFRKQWQKCLTLAILNYNTTYHTSFGCETS